MKKIIALSILTIIACVFAASPCFCQNRFDTTDEELRVFEGKVVDVDTGKSVLKVRGVTDIDFPIDSDTTLQNDSYAIELSDMDPGDYVTVQYYRKESESRSPMKVISVTVKNKPQ